MNDDEQNFEGYLREFQPVRLRALPLVARPSLGPRRAAAVVIAAAVIAAVCWVAISQNSPANPEPPSAKRQPPVVSVRELTRVALDDPAQLDVRIDEAAPSVLPCCQGSQSSLAALAKE
jgi:ferric-dicitrate binding protein FerR (iron transport regulator)